MTYLDGSKLIMGSEDVLMEVEESHVDYRKDNFTLEIYEYIEIEEHPKLQIDKLLNYYVQIA